MQFAIPVPLLLALLLLLALPPPAPPPPAPSAGERPSGPRESARNANKARHRVDRRILGPPRHQTGRPPSSAPSGRSMGQCPPWRATFAIRSRPSWIRAV